MRKLFVLVASVALVSAGCGGSSKAPTAPSSSQGSPSSPSSPVTPASATINGTVQTGGAAASGMTVAVMSTALTTRSDNAGRFSLTNVPAGDVQLRITGPGADAIAPVGTVQPSETREIVVTVSGSTAKVETPGHNEAEGEVDGAIEAISSPNLTVAGRSVHTDSSTIIRNGSQTVGLSALKVGMRVEAHGTLSGSTINATRIEVLGNDDNEPNPNPNPGPNPGPNNPGAESEMKGVVSNLSGTASSFTFKIGSQTVKGDSSTKFEGSGESGESMTTSDDGRASGFSALKNGVTVEVRGTMSGTTLQANRIQIEDDNEDNEDNDANEVELKGALGTISALGSGCPTIRSTVSGTTFTTSSSTRFEASCSSLKSGDRVEVQGSRQANGSVLASRVKKDD